MSDERGHSGGPGVSQPGKLESQGNPASFQFRLPWMAFRFPSFPQSVFSMSNDKWGTTYYRIYRSVPLLFFTEIYFFRRTEMYRWKGPVLLPTKVCLNKGQSSESKVD